MKDQELSKIDIANLITYPQPIIFEVGCYDGKDSRELRDVLTNRGYSPTFFCFEADKRSQELFESFKSVNSYMYLIPKAVSNVDGYITLFKSDSETRRHDHNSKSWSASSSIKKPKTHLELFPDVEFKDQEIVMSTRLDTFYINGFKGQLIDFMWVDINGAEAEFLDGAQGVLSAKTKYLYIEFSDKELYENQITKQTILDKLSWDFELVDTYNFKGNFGNILLKNKNLVG